MKCRRYDPDPSSAFKSPGYSGIQKRAQEISEKAYTGTVRAGLASKLHDHRYQASTKPVPTGIVFASNLLSNANETADQLS